MRRQGIAFPHQHPHEANHLRPLMSRLKEHSVLPRARPKVVVHATTRPPVRGAWNVQVFHGLGDKGYVLNPLFLQRGRWPRLRTAGNMLLHRLGRPAGLLRPPASPGVRRGRYQMVNAYGPRFRDALAAMLRGTEVEVYGHVALNERPALRPDPDGPVLWLPTWDNSRYLGGASQTGLPAFADAVTRLASSVGVRVKYHPLTVRNGQHAAERRRLEADPRVEVLPADTDAYDALQGVRAVLTDTSSLGFEAYCLGFPVAVARPDDAVVAGLHAELEQRVPRLLPERASLAHWAADPDRPGDRAWAEDLMAPPHPRRNDAFAARLREALA